MARPPGTLRVGRYFLALGLLLAVLYTIVFLPGNRHTPKLGIDLVGGVRVIFTARGNTTSTQMAQARQIMEDRVNSSGVTGSTVQVQGNNQILILIPNGTGQDVKNLGAAAKLNFRGVVASAVPVTCGKFAPPASAQSSSTATGTGAPTTGSSGSGSSGAPTSTAPTSAPASSITGATSKPSSGAGSAPVTSASVSRGAAPAPRSPAAAYARPLTAPSPGSASTAPGSAATSGAPSSAAAASSGAATSGAATSGAATSGAAAAKPAKCAPGNSIDTLGKTLTIPTTDKAFNALKAADQQKIGQALTNYNCDQAQDEPDISNKYYVVCGKDINPQLPNQRYAFLLGHVIVPGTQIDDVNASAPNGTQTAYTVNLTLKTKGSDDWAKYTAANNIGGSSSSTNASVGTCGPSATPCADFVAFTLNGEVISAPVNESAINGGTTQITGDFTQDSANQLAQQLKFGSLPLTFRLEANQDVSATLGSSQLKAALLAGGIGLILVVVYSLLYYRALGLVTIASLLVSAALVYALLVILGTQMGFTLDLAGVTGFIVALGITADSFVVFFERLKDEVHEGRTVRTAVPRAWVRARRTILSADTVSFLAAAILYFFASADVKGFAFTLGLSTILDLIVVFLFTHPIVSLLSRSAAFGSPRFTGLNAVRAGGAVLEPGSAPRSATERARGRRGSGSRATAPTSDPVSSTDSGVVNSDNFVDSDILVDERPVEDSPDVELTDLPAGESESVAEPDRPRRRTAPAPGTAAERAAARRAKMRSRDEDGDR